jgi:hypothetical protein
LSRINCNVSFKSAGSSAEPIADLRKLWVLWLIHIAAHIHSSNLSSRRFGFIMHLHYSIILLLAAVPHSLQIEVVDHNLISMNA